MFINAVSHCDPKKVIGEKINQTYVTKKQCRDVVLLIVLIVQQEKNLMKMSHTHMVITKVKFSNLG